MPLARALQLAREREADLVEVAPSAVPPVCRLLDYDRFRYEQSRRERLARKHQKATLVKEIRLRPKIDGHDVDTKVRQAERHLADGDKVKLTVLYRGREMSHIDLGRNVLARVVTALSSVGAIESPAVIEGRRLSLVMSPSAKSKAQRPPTEG